MLVGVCRGRRAATAAAGVRFVAKPEPAGVTACGFVAADFFRSACDRGGVTLTGGGAWRGGGTTSVWGGVEAARNARWASSSRRAWKARGARSFVLAAARQVASRSPGDTILLRRRSARWKRRWSHASHTVSSFAGRDQLISRSAISQRPPQHFPRGLEELLADRSAVIVTEVRSAPPNSVCRFSLPAR